MKILIAYATRYGTTEKCAKILAGILKEKSHIVTLVNLKKEKKLKPDNYDAVIIGGSFVAFRMSPLVRKFVKKNLNYLINMRTGIFICGADEDWEKQIKKGFPEELLDKAVTKGYFGYELNWDKMNPLIRSSMQKAWKTDKNISKIKNDNIEKFAEEVV